MSRSHVQTVKVSAFDEREERRSEEVGIRQKFTRVLALDVLRSVIVVNVNFASADDFSQVQFDRSTSAEFIASRVVPYRGEVLFAHFDCSSTLHELGMIS